MIASAPPRGEFATKQSHVNVTHTLADPNDFASGGRDHVNAAIHQVEGAQPEVGAFVAVIGVDTAGTVPHAKTRVEIDVGLDVTLLWEGAFDRQAQGGFSGLRCV